MKNDIKKTVNLRKQEKRSAQIDQVYNDQAGNNEDLKKISRPQPRRVNEGLTKRIIIVIAIIIVGFLIYQAIANNRLEKTAQEISWYSVKLVDGKIYYGQIKDLTTDPVEINNVYYDYDQVKGDPSASSGQEKSETENIRLVKRGKETHGPTGTMYVVRDQIVQFEELSENSKVLKVILENEQ